MFPTGFLFTAPPFTKRMMKQIWLPFLIIFSKKIIIKEGWDLREV